MIWFQSFILMSGFKLQRVSIYVQISFTFVGGELMKMTMSAVGVAMVVLDACGEDDDES